MYECVCTRVCVWRQRCARDKHMCMGVSLGVVWLCGGAYECVLWVLVHVLEGVLMKRLCPRNVCVWEGVTAGACTDPQL